MTFEAQRQQISVPVPAAPTSSILHIFERALRDVSLPIERAREIYNLQREIEFDLAEREYIRVRSLMEQELEPVARDAANPQTKSRYATLPQVIQAVRPIYSKHGIVVEFDTADSQRGEAWIKVLAFLSHEGGYKRTYHIDMPADGKGAQGRDVMTRTHATGSAVSYGRRYLLLMIFNIAVGGEDDDGNAAGKRDNPHTVRPEDIEDIPPPDHPDRLPPGDPDIKPLPKKNAREDFAKMQKELHAIRDVEELKKWGSASRNRMATFPLDWQEIMRGIYVAHLASLRAKSPTLKAFEESAWLVDLQNAYENCEDMAEFFKVDQDMYEPWWPSVTEEARNEASKIRQARLNEIENPE